MSNSVTMLHEDYMKYAKAVLEEQTVQVNMDASTLYLIDGDLVSKKVYKKKILQELDNATTLL
jgi:hypothetical protein